MTTKIQVPGTKYPIFDLFREETKRAMLDLDWSAADWPEIPNWDPNYPHQDEERSVCPIGFCLAREHTYEAGVIIDWDVPHALGLMKELGDTTLSPKARRVKVQASHFIQDFDELRRVRKMTNELLAQMAGLSEPASD